MAAERLKPTPLTRKLAPYAKRKDGIIESPMSVFDNIPFEAVYTETLSEEMDYIKKRMKEEFLIGLTYQYHDSLLLMSKKLNMDMSSFYYVPVHKYQKIGSQWNEEIESKVRSRVPLSTEINRYAEELWLKQMGETFKNDSIRKANVDKFETGLALFQDCAAQHRYNDHCYDTIRIKKFCTWNNEDDFKDIPLENYFLALQISPFGEQRMDSFVRDGTTKKQVEIVLAQMKDDDISWNRMFEKITTVDRRIDLSNRAETNMSVYLDHIINNYDNLAEWTVFSAGNVPQYTTGVVQEEGLATGTKWADYVLADYKGQNLDYLMYYTMAYNFEDKTYV
eukprot:UN32041